MYQCFVISPTTLPGTKAAKGFTNNEKHIRFKGRLKPGMYCRKTLGIKPSLLMEKNTRDCPNNNTNITEE